MGELSYFDNMKLQRIYNNAIDQCKRVDTAKAKCESAYDSIECYIKSLSESWQGDGATAVFEKLEEMKIQLTGIVESLSALSSKMYAEAGQVNTEWPALNIEKMYPEKDIEIEQDG